MPRPLPTPVRESIIRMSQLGVKNPRIAAFLGVSKRSVRNIFRLWVETGSVHSSGDAALGHPRKLEPGMVAYIRERLAHRPDMYLDELKADLAKNCGIDFSIQLSGVLSSAVASHSRRYAKISTKAMLSKHRSEVLRFEYCEVVQQLRPSMFVFVDESAIDRRATYRNRGYAPSGERVSTKAFFIRGERYSILPAFSLSGVLGLDVVRGSFTAETFLNFIEKLLANMNPFPGDNSVIVMDNCRIHRSQEVLDLIIQSDMHYIFLPPYSPDYNPIETAFSTIKASIRRSGDIARFNMMDQDAPNAEAAIEAMFFRHVFSVTTKDAAGWFRKCGY
ncbi:hypothetical protein RSAG8_07205, partial [Rhizoctonia solani AG-8 WAC10335]